MSTITLTQCEQRICEYVAKLRVASDRKANTFNCNTSERSDLELDLQGFGSELAFCKLFNVFPDFTLEPRSAVKGQDNGDCVLDGLRIDVKTTYKAKDTYYIKARKRGCADVFALMEGIYPSFRLIGLVRHDTVFFEANKRVFSNGDVCYGVETWILAPTLKECV